MSATSAKTRSPNYPVLNLEEALGRVREIYKKQHTHPATREVIAKLIGYSSLNGASGTVISALGKYGLLEGRNDQLRVTPLALDLILHRKGDPEYTDALRTAAFLPALFSELRDQYPGRLPSEHSLRAALIKRGFNPNAVDDAIRNYRDTLAFVDAETEGADTDYPDESPPEVPMQTRPIESDILAPWKTTTMPAMTSVPNMVPYNLPLGAQGIAILQVPAQLNEASWNLMMAVLEAMKPGIVTEPERQAPAMLAASTAPALPATIPDEGESEPGA